MATDFNKVVEFVSCTRFARSEKGASESVTTTCLKRPSTSSQTPQLLATELSVSPPLLHSTIIQYVMCDV